jgi:hypothetical protein
MNTQRPFQLIIYFFLFVLSIAAYTIYAVAQPDHDPGVYAIFGIYFTSANGISLIILAIYYSYVMVEEASMHAARIKNVEFLVHEKDLPSFYSLAVDLLSEDIEPEEIEMLMSMAYPRFRRFRGDQADNQRDGASCEKEAFFRSFIQESPDEFSAYRTDPAA